MDLILKSLVINASAVACQSISSINPWLTSQLTLNWHPDWYSIDSPSTSQLTVDQRSVDSRLSVDQLCNVWTKVDSWLTCWSSVDLVSSDCQLRCQWSFDWLSIKGLSVDQGYQSRCQSTFDSRYHSYKMIFDGLVIDTAHTIQSDLNYEIAWIYINYSHFDCQAQKEP